MNLSFNAETGDFEGIATYNDKQYSMTLVDFEAEHMQKATDLATQINNWLNEGLESVKQFTATSLIKLKNESWLDEDQPLVSEDVFINTIELDGVLVFSDGSFEVYFDDNDLFWGHTIKVDIDQSFEIEGANLWG
ncbi:MULTISPECIES: DUF2262 domain-containing protein [Mucilaginibacter]|uniref:DUF2262 domain-containing protein n=1 Tax=Mucilaginibacter TaxID=423349 RepID=UPI002092C9F6|nr:MULTISPECIES: DUF2262 domain-containing protein [Mucilaginibacter]MCO5948793.1 DUF2262 domain-containing protein [Mucilaginibacter flavidus]